MRNSILYLITLTLLVSCKKSTDVKELNFEVNINSASFKVNDTVEFKFSGDNPDIISFYSGDGKSDYAFLDTDKEVDARTSLSFSSAKFAGNNADCARLLYSTNFNGQYNLASVQQAIWTDITHRFHVPPINGTGPTLEFSGNVDLTDIFPADGSPVYFAWYYTIQPNSQRSRFRMQNFTVAATVTEDPNLSSVHYDFTKAGFQIVLGSSWGGVAAGSLPRVEPTFVIFDGTFTNTIFREAWAITTAMQAPERANIGKAIAVGIKSFDSSPISTHKYVYQRAGTYNATFVGQNINVYDSKKVIKTVKITVEN